MNNDKSNIINLIPTKDSPELFQDKTHKDYDEFLKFNINDPLKKYDYFFNNYNKYLYYIYDIKTIDNKEKYYVINLLNNEPEEFEYPFNYIKVDGNDPNVLKNIYHCMCKKMKK